MTLMICPECGKEISDKASACPSCGANVAALKRAALPFWKRNRSAIIAGLSIGLPVAFCSAYVMNAPIKSDPLQDARNSCADAIISKLNDPNSAEFPDKFSASAGKTGENTYSVVMTVRAKNAFGGTVTTLQYCQVTKRPDGSMTAEVSQITPK